MKSYLATKEILTALDTYGDYLVSDAKNKYRSDHLEKFFNLLNSVNNIEPNTCIDQCINAYWPVSKHYSITYYDKYKNKDHVEKLDLSDILENINQLTYILSMFDEEYIYVTVFNLKKDINTPEQKLSQQQLINIARKDGLIDCRTYTKMYYAP